MQGSAENDGVHLSWTQDDYSTLAGYNVYRHPLLAFYMYGGMYNVFNGTEVENIAVDFINEATGQIINSANSRDMGE